jgi:hypothetical protein
MRTFLIASLLLPTLAHAEIEFPPETMRPARTAKAKKRAPVLAPAKEVEPAVTQAKPGDAEQPASIPAAPVVVAVTDTDAAVEPAGTVTATVTPQATHRDKWIEPYGAIAGGVHLQSLHQAPDVKTQEQNPTVAVSRLGIRGGTGRYVTFASEFEASLGGPMGYGSSVWEGQAAIAIRDQYVRYARDGWSIAAGRVADPASYDYVSAHVGDLLYTDLYTRDPLLYSGADRGNGLFGSYQLTKNLTVAGTFHSTNPTGITGTLAIGGKLQPFDRPFYLAAAQVGNSQNNLPDQNLHIYFGSPALMFKSEHIEAKAEVQMYSLDTQQSITDDQSIRGYNLRLGVRGHIDTQIGELSPYANASRNKNEILDPTDSKYRLPDLFRSYTFSTGVDLNIREKSGIGASYAVVDTREPAQHVREHYMNLGASYWVENGFAIGLRGSIFAQQISGETMTTGARSVFMTARLVLD